MQIAAVEQILNWGASNVQAYCEELVNSILPVYPSTGSGLKKKFPPAIFLGFAHQWEFPLR